MSGPAFNGWRNFSPSGAKALEGPLRESMIRKSGNHFCEKIMLKPLNLREFFSTR
jgi:hypothetical protein